MVIIQKKNLNNNLVWAVYIDRENNLWTGTDKGVNFYSSEEKRFTYYRMNEGENTKLTDNMISAIIEDNSDNIWIGTFFGGLNRFNKKSKELFHYRHDPKDTHSIISDRILALYYDEPEILWIGTYGRGLDRFDLKKGRFIHSNNALLNNRIITVIYKDPSGNIWVGSNHELGMITKNKDTVNYMIAEGIKKDLYITSIYQDTFNRFWTGLY